MNMKAKMGRRFWLTLVIFSLTGQIAWVVENMYFNVFIYKMFHATAAQISLMVSASAVTAFVTTILIGALSDRIGKRKIFVCGGYVLWGISILAFTLVRMDVLSEIAGSVAGAMSLGVALVIVLDCIMTFFGSAANDACFNAWMTDRGDDTNRGKIEGINSMMPLLAILLVFGGFMVFDLDQASSWTILYLIIGILVLLIGVGGFFLLEDRVKSSPENKQFMRNVLYSFRYSTLKQNRLLYAVVGAFALFGISIQIFMPYLILYYEKSLGMDNYVLIMAPAIVVAAVITAFYGKLYDLLGFEVAVIPSMMMLMGGYVILFLCVGVIPVFIGSLLMMSGYLTGMAMFGAMIRDHIPEDRAGMFQGIRMIGQVLIPGIAGPFVGALVLRNAEQVVNADGTTSFLPNRMIFLAALVAAGVLCVVLFCIFRMIHTGHRILSTDSETGTGIPFEEYPRPQMRRESYQTLNGEWMLNRSKIVVPYPPQSDLSGYGKHVGSHLVYERDFTVAEDFLRGRVLLHFGAVDQVAEISLNGEQVGVHEGGYLPFTLDITEQCVVGGSNHLTVKVTDTLSPRYPYGKQRKKRGGMWYTPVSGIWQSVWLESVPETYIGILRMLADLNGVTITTDQEHYTVTIHTEQGDITAESHGKTLRIELRDAVTGNGETCIPHLWSPEDPYLYETTLTCGEDRVETYFAMRTISVEKKEGQNRICLNGKPYFLHGVLDQGYYPEGIFLPGSEQGYVRDILAMKELGLNTLRKHIKIEPEWFYYQCDKLGMLVMQDMVNSGKYHFIRDTAIPTLGYRGRSDTKNRGDQKRKAFFEQHMKDTVEHLYNHPCIVYYTIFNEGWGQFDSDRMYGVMREMDGSRIIDTTSGWFHKKKSDVVSVHIYFKLMKLHKSFRPMVLSECGGYAYQIPEHSYSLYGRYGYGSCASSEALTDQIVDMYEKMILPYIAQGLAGCVYTQLSDVEDEINGFYTYDRKVCKVDAERIAAISHRIMEEIAKY